MDDTFPTRRDSRRQAFTVLVSRRLSPLVLLLVLAGPAGCSQFIGTTAQSFLMKIRDSPDPNVRYVAYAKLASPQCYVSDAQKAEAVKTLVAKLEGSQEPIATRAVICRTLGELRDPASREALI